MLGVQRCEMAFSSTLEGGGHIGTSIRSRKTKIVFAILSRVCRLRLPMSTAHHMCEANKYTAQPKDDDWTEHYEFNWCLRADPIRLTCSQKPASRNRTLAHDLCIFNILNGDGCSLRPCPSTPSAQGRSGRLPDPIRTDLWTISMPNVSPS